VFADNFTDSELSARCSDLHYGRADWGSGDNMALVAAGDYRVPDVITDLVTRDDGPINETRMPESYFQAIRHEGVEVYSRSTNYLISAGGTWQDSLDRDSYLGRHGEDTNGTALATTLMPVWGAADRDDLIRLDGKPDAKARYNSCVAPRRVWVVPNNVMPIQVHSSLLLLNSGV
jgi:hypothetical protein